MDKDQTSYVIVICKENADPRYNKLQLRTDPPTYIELQPGENILTVEDYPALKYGFKQITNYNLDEYPDAINEYNCGDVTLVDLSHFDTSEMTSMDMMFCRMENLEFIIFGDTNIENITSMNRSFEWIAVEKLDLTKINFSKVTDAEMMAYSQIKNEINLAGCDLSNIVVADGIFNGVTELNLDRAKLSGAVIEAMAQEDEFGCGFLKEISMRGCDIKMIRSVLKSIMENDSDTLSRIQVILDKDVENQLLTSIAPVNSWIPKHRKEWYMTITDGTLLNYNNEILKLIIEKLRKDNLIEEIFYTERLSLPKQLDNYYPRENVYSVGMQFPSILIKTFFDWEIGKRSARHSELYSFIVGNYYAAFSNNPKLKWYVPVLHKGFYTIEDALNTVVYSGFKDLSDCRIIEIQYLNPSSLPKILHHSAKWSPFTAGKFNLSDNWEEKFKKTFSDKEATYQSFVEQCLTKLSHTKFNHSVVCTDAKGNKHLINPSKVVKISPYPKDDKVLASVSLEGGVTLTVDLLIFTKELTGFIAVDNSKFMGKRIPTDISVPETDLAEVFKSMGKDVLAIIEKRRKETAEQTLSSEDNDEDDFDLDSVYVED